MTNIERIKAMNTENFINTMFSLHNCKFRKYVDLIAYMNGESENLSDYLNVKYYALFTPCEMEIKAFEIACADFDFDERKLIEDHSRILPVVDEYSLQGYTFCVVVNEYNNIEKIDYGLMKIKYGKERPTG